MNLSSLYKFLQTNLFIASAVSLMISCNKELPEAEPIKTPEPAGSPINTLLNDGDFSVLKAAIAKATPASSSGQVPLSALLSDNTAVFTFFAPNNAALEMVGITSITLPFISAGKLDTLLRYHLVGGQKITSAVIPTTFPNMQLPTSLVLAPPSISLPPGLRMSIFPSKRGQVVWVNNIPVLQGDIAASNGVIHKVAFPLLPPSEFLWNRIDTDPELTYLKAAIKKADEGADPASSLEAALKNPAANLTIFAPTDAAMKATLTGLITRGLMAQGMDQATAAATAAALASSPAVFTNPALAGVLTPQTVKGIVVYHMLGSRAFTINLPADPALIKTLLNSAIAAHPGVLIDVNFGASGSVTEATVKGAANATASNVLINSTPAPSGTSDQHYINGVIHKIDQVLLPQ